MKLAIVMSALLLIGSCSSKINSDSQVEKEFQDSFNTIIVSNPVDTLIHFDIDGFSLEGTGVNAYYHKGIIDSATIGVYGETFQVQMKYVFEESMIKATERQYEYAKEVFYEIESEDDILLVDSFSYLMNYSGEIMDIDSGHETTNIFNDFRKTVPLTLAE